MSSSTSLLHVSQQLFTMFAQEPWPLLTELHVRRYSKGEVYKALYKGLSLIFLL